MLGYEELHTYLCVCFMVFIIGQYSIYLEYSMLRHINENDYEINVAMALFKHKIVNLNKMQTILVI